MSTESVPAIPVVTVPDVERPVISLARASNQEEPASFDFATQPAVLQPQGTFQLNQSEFASMISGEDVSIPPPTATPAVTPVSEKPLEKPLHYDLKLPQPVVYTPLLHSKKVKRVKGGGGKKGKK